MTQLLCAIVLFCGAADAVAVVVVLAVATAIDVATDDDE